MSRIRTDRIREDLVYSATSNPFSKNIIHSGLPPFAALFEVVNDFGIDAQCQLHFLTRSDRTPSEPSGSKIFNLRVGERLRIRIRQRGTRDVLILGSIRDD